MAALQNITEDRTSVFIAHRLSTVVDANEILVLEHGRIKERGNHYTLISDPNSFYSYLWHKQHEVYADNNKRDSATELKMEDSKKANQRYDFQVPEAITHS